MFRNLSYKRKFHLLLLFIVVLGFTAYKRSFKGTLEAINFYRESMDKIDARSSATLELSDLKTEIRVLDDMIGKKAKNPTLVQNEILGFLSQRDEDITLAKIENLHISDDSYFRIYSNIITLKGKFNPLIKTIYEFESNFEYARIASMTFRVERNNKTSKIELYNDIIFQNYEKK
ncbi:MULTISPECIES: hypothetical protein [Aequorivita]|uniref:Uncharacterized protein n=1 Tax=Aequorivita iocasae TaxID=2803865 RepID=A0ABX7DRS1_9FLAO|nr:MULTISPECIES: hypothetical protein [Aequorivita]QQX76510.1 hypothetical protein JK629_14475 [Aequorivita iocasae]UCA55982.1 hypothetical protein LDL78_14545 [Aequorivita sp. F7]